MARNPIAAIRAVGAAITTRQSAALCVFVLGLLIASCRRSTSASLERPIVLSALTLLWSGIGLLLYTRCNSGEWASSVRYLREIVQSRTRNEVFGNLAVPVALVSRTFLFRYSLWWTQCTVQGGLIPFLPAALILADWAWPRNHDHHTPEAASDRLSLSPPRGLWSHLTRIAEKQTQTRQRFPTRHFVLAIAWAVLADHLVAPAAQTDTGLVCPTGTLLPAAGLAQLVVRAFDAGALFLAGRRRRVGTSSQPGKEPGPRPVSGVYGVHRLALDCFAAALVMLSFLAATSFFLTSSLREIAAAPAVRRLVVKDLVLDSLTATGVLLSGLYLLAYLSPTTLALVIAAALASTHPNLEPVTAYGVVRPNPTHAVLVPGIFAAISLALLSQTTIRLDIETSKPPAPDKHHHKRRLAACLALLTLLLAASSTRAVLSQPRDALLAIQDSQRGSDDWIRTAGASQTAAEAAAAYRRRYGRPPPPHFDRWVAFALARGSPVIDTFDQIHGDLAPFRGLSPAELRGRTSQLLAARGGLGIGAVRIRGGDGKGRASVELGPGSPPTHFWMLEAWRDMIGPFAADLPDMDLAFNLDDECRVAVPAAVLDKMPRGNDGEEEEDNNKKKKPPRGWFSKAARSPWDETAFAEPGHVPRPDYFRTGKPKLGIYDSFVAPACPPGSAALRHRWPDGTRAVPAARGGIITGTPDLCDRPDLARLSGFLASPGGPGGSGPAITQRLVPVFSQARAVGGFNDILVPSPWHFADKVVVEEGKDMGWVNKSDAVFWRGSSSDGWAEGGKWPGFLRARLANLAKGAAGGSTPPGLSSFSARGRRPDVPAVDVSFSGEFTRCSSSACRSMTATFYGHSSSPDGPPTTDFQDHWSYRHIIDVDGTGFSGRFLSFLQSKSTAYRATVFRTWMDERIHPWRHFVPLDVSLSGLWEVVWLVSRGFVVRRSKGDVLEEAAEGEEVPLARKIAMEGHEWAARALRKEDMQVYMFRLLLEWGRLVDDRRDELGYEP